MGGKQWNTSKTGCLYKGRPLKYMLRRLFCSFLSFQGDSVCPRRPVSTGGQFHGSQGGGDQSLRPSWIRPGDVCLVCSYFSLFPLHLSYDKMMVHFVFELRVPFAGNNGKCWHFMKERVKAIYRLNQASSKCLFSLSLENITEFSELPIQLSIHCYQGCRPRQCLLSYLYRI